MTFRIGLNNFYLTEKNEQIDIFFSNEFCPSKCVLFFSVLSAHWKSYWMEMIMIAGLVAYFANYFVGRNKNSKIASLWLQTHRSLLEDNFAGIGDDTQKEREGPDGFIKESESVYTLWCSGRSCCEGMLVELKLIRRQDLVAVISDLLKPSQDQLHIKIELSSDIMDPFVFCVATKRSASKFFKEMYDLVSM